MKKIITSLVVCFLIAALLIGCFKDKANDEPTNNSGAITVAHALGTLVAPEKPERIGQLDGVTMMLRWHEGLRQ